MTSGGRFATVSLVRRLAADAWETPRSGARSPVRDHRQECAVPRMSSIKPLFVMLIAASALAACASSRGPAAPATPTVDAAPPVAVITPAPLPVSAVPRDFGSCVADLKQRAVTEGIPYEVADASLRDVRENQRVIELDRSQPEFVQTFGQYLDKRLSRARIDRGQIGRAHV